MSQKRSIFEEVSSDGAAKSAPGGGMIDAQPKGARRAIRVWLFILFAMVMAMIAVGGATRLTDSGLSITRWKPVSGALPPMNRADWQSEYDLYRQSPQFRLANPDMTLPQFKRIFWWEWGHRNLGRLIGLVWFIGLAAFWATRRIPPGWHGRLFSIGILVGIQGAIGWWMVASGLVGQMTTVASYRLAAHLGIGFAILGVIAWFALQLGRSQAQLIQARRMGEPRLVALATITLALAFVQVLLGALTAGIDAGAAFPTWPSMNGEFVPSSSFDYTPLWRNFFENPGLVQFNHRMLGYTVFVIGLFTAFRGHRSSHQHTREIFALMGAMIVLQVVLGIATAVWFVHCWWLGLIHQIGAVITFTLILRARHAARYPQIRSIRETI